MAEGKISAGFGQLLKRNLMSTEYRTRGDGGSPCTRLPCPSRRYGIINTFDNLVHQLQGSRCKMPIHLPYIVCP